MEEVSREKILACYRGQVMETGEVPASVFKFCREAELGERQFYQHFSSFTALESQIWADLHHRTAKALADDADFPNYSCRQKLAAYFYTFFEIALDERSFMLLRFPQAGNCACPKVLHRLRDHFEDWAHGIISEGLEKGEIAERGMLTQQYQKGLYLVMRGLIEFWINDESAQFERTDALIEKSVTAYFDLIRQQALDSLGDLLRFLAGRTSN